MYILKLKCYNEPIEITASYYKYDDTFLKFYTEDNRLKPSVVYMLSEVISIKRV